MKLSLGNRFNNTLIHSRDRNPQAKLDNKNRLIKSINALNGQSLGIETNTSRSSGSSIHRTPSGCGNALGQISVYQTEISSKNNLFTKDSINTRKTLKVSPMLTHQLFELSWV